MTKKQIKKVVKIGMRGVTTWLLLETAYVLGKAQMLDEFVPLIMDAESYDKYMSILCDSVKTIRNPITRTRAKLVLIAAGKYTHKES